MHQINPADAQRIDRRQDDRGIYVGLLREGGMTPPASDTVWPLTDADMRELRKPLPAGCDQQGRYVTRRVDTGGMQPGEICTEIGAEDGSPRRQRVPEGGAISVGLVVIAVCAALDLIFG